MAYYCIVNITILRTVGYLFFSSLGAFHVPLIARLLGHMAQIIALGFNFLSGEHFLQAENSTGCKWDKDNCSGVFDGTNQRLFMD